MSTGFRLRTLGAALFLAAAVLCASLPTLASATTAHSQHKRAKKKTPPPPPPPLPSGPTGPVQQIPLDSIAAVPPQVTFQNNVLTIVAPNSTLADILRAVKKQTGAEIDVPVAPERVVTRLGPGPAHDVLSDLLNGSRFNYVLLGAPGNESVLTRVVLVPKTGNSAESTPAPQPTRPAIAQNPPAEEDPSAQAVDADSDDATNNVDETPEQPAADDQQQNAEQPQVKTPQQMLQEMQQRQLMLQQQQPPNQPPVPGSGMPPHPPQEQ